MLRVFVRGWEREISAFRSVQLTVKSVSVPCLQLPAASVPEMLPALARSVRVNTAIIHVLPFPHPDLNGNHMRSTGHGETTGKGEAMQTISH